MEKIGVKKMKWNHYLGFLILLIGFTTLTLHSQSTMDFESGTDIVVETGADICADVITINGTFSGGGTKCGGALPVELVSFNAAVSDNKVTLNWQTATEVNNYGFEIERKAHPNPSQREELSLALWGDWVALGFVKGNGNSNSTKQYSFTDNTATSGKYIYRLKQMDNDGKYEYSKEVEVTVEAPLNFELAQNYPNPFNPSTSIKYKIAQAGNVSLKIFNILGKQVATMVDEYQNAGQYQVEFSSVDYKLASGVYYYILRANSFYHTRRMILLK